jgi:hypothetical protein
MGMRTGWWRHLTYRSSKQEGLKAQLNYKHCGKGSLHGFKSVKVNAPYNAHARPNNHQLQHQCFQHFLNLHIIKLFMISSDFEHSTKVRPSQPQLHENSFSIVSRNLQHICASASQRSFTSEDVVT